MLEYASERLRNDKDVVLMAIINEGGGFEYASETLQADVEILEALRK